MLDCVVPDFAFIAPNKPVECWSANGCKQYLKFYKLEVGKSACAAAQSNAVGAFHNESTPKIPPEK
eukprot:10060179-Ditylum_brightwellii.AAC.1